MLKKITVLAMAVGVVAALALPASAAADWEHHEVPIQTDVQLGLTGKVRFQGGLGGVECQITSRAKFLAFQTTGTAETFAAHPTGDTANCVGLGGLAFCQIHNLTPQQTNNWTFHTAAWQTVTQVHSNGQTTFGETHQRAAVVTAQTLESQLTGGFCPVKKVVLHPNSVALTEEEQPTTTVGDGKTVTNLDVNGTATATLETNSGALDQEETLVQGTVQVESPNQNTYDL
jgi:hypothetical protein